MIWAPIISVQYETAASSSCRGILILIGEGGICDVIPEIKIVPEIIADDDETFNLLECVSSIDCAHLETGIVGVGVLAANNSHSFFIHDIVITFFVSSPLVANGAMLL